MSYLSRLVRQSGLAAGPVRRPAPVAPAAEPLALEVEEVRETAPPPAAPAPVVAAPSIASPPSTADAAPPPAVPPRAEPEVRVVRELVRAEAESPAPPSVPDRRPPAAAEESVRPAASSGIVEIETTREAPADRVDSGVAPTAGIERVERRSVRAADPHPPRAVPAPPPAPLQPVDAERAFAARLAEVRAWVAATPAPGEVVETAATVDGVTRTAVPAPRADVETRTPMRAAERPAIDLSALAAGAPAETNHFTLSIGTLQLTVEEPPRPAVPPAAPAAPASGGVSLPAASRLGRHYLRV